MYKVFVENGLTYCGGDLSKCHICCDLIIPNGEDEALKHVIDPDHRESFEAVAWCRLPQTEILKELKSLTEADYCKLVQNNISFKNNAFNCNFCCRYFHSWQFVEEHMLSKTHLENMAINFKKLLEQSIFFKHKCYFCKVCHRQFKHIEAANAHSSSQSHKCNLEKKSKENLATNKNQAPQDLVNDRKNVNNNDCLKMSEEDLVNDRKNENNDDHLKKSEEETPDKEFAILVTENKVDIIVLKENKLDTKIKSSKMYCKACKYYIPVSKLYTHINSPAHLKNVYTSNSNTYYYNAKKSPALVEYFYCRRCDMWLKKNEVLLQSHCMLHLHQDLPNLKYDIFSFDFNTEKVKITCLICNYIMHSDKDLADHVSKIQHLQQWQKNLLSKNNEKQEVLTVENFYDLSASIAESTILNVQKNIFLHLKCNCIVPTNVDKYGHICDFEQKSLNESHVKDHVQEEYHINLNKTFMCYKCFMCDLAFLKVEDLIQHYFDSSLHKLRYNNCHDKLKYSLLNKHNLAYERSKEDRQLITFSKETTLINKSSEPAKSIEINENLLRPVHEIAKHPSDAKDASRNHENMSQNFYCQICKLYIPMEKISYVQSHCMYHLHKENPDKNDDILKFRFTNKGLRIQCLLCDWTIISYDLLEPHFRMKKHHSRIKSLDIHGNYTNGMKEIKMFPESTPLDINEGFHPTKNFSVESFCLMCYIPEIGSDGLISNFSYETIANHEHRIENSKRSENIPSYMKIDYYKCYLCNASCVNKETLLNHYENDAVHLQKMAKVGKKSRPSDEPSKQNQCGETKMLDVYGVRKPRVPKLEESKNSEVKEIERDLVKKVKQTLVLDQPKNKSVGNESFNNDDDDDEEVNKNDGDDEDGNDIDDEEDDGDSDVNDKDNDNEEDDDEEEVESSEEKSKKIDSDVRYSKEKRDKVSDHDFLHPYNKEIDEYGKQFLMACIEPGERNIYTFATSELELMKLGISVIFPSIESNCICLACDYEMELDPQILFEHLMHETHIENLTELRKSEPDEINVLSYLDMAEDSIIEITNDEVHCIVCDSNLHNSHESIYKHTKSKTSQTHKSKLEQCKQRMDLLSSEYFELLANFWYCAHHFYCTVCQLEMQSELNFIRHLELPEHLDRVQVLERRSTGSSFGIDKCLTCCSCWYGPVVPYSKHCDDYFHNLSRNRRGLMMPKLDKKSVAKLASLVNSTCVTKNLIRESNRVMRTEQIQENQLLEDIERTVRPLYPRAQAYAFGSRSSCLGLHTSDMDVFLDLENCYHEKGSKAASQNYIRRLNRQFFSVCKQFWRKDTILLTPRVPIIKLEHRFSRLKCDLSFINGLGVEKSLLIRKYVTAYQGCRELILYLKKWFDAVKLYGPRGMNAYAITWFAIFYLQTLGIFPSIHQLKQEAKSKIVDGWECGFPKKITMNSSTSNYAFKDLLLGFFDFYAKFDYQTCVVCPLMGRIVRKIDFLHVDKMPVEMEIYKKRLKSENLEYFRYDSAMCIQDPVDLSQNITKAVKKIQLDIFRQYCLQSHKLM